MQCIWAEFGAVVMAVDKEDKALESIADQVTYTMQLKEIGIRSLDEMNPAPGANDILKEGDLLIVLGHNNDLKKITKL